MLETAATASMNSSSLEPRAVLLLDWSSVLLGLSIERGQLSHLYVNKVWVGKTIVVEAVSLVKLLSVVASQLILSQ